MKRETPSESVGKRSYCSFFQAVSGSAGFLGDGAAPRPPHSHGAGRELALRNRCQMRGGMGERTEGTHASFSQKPGICFVIS